MVVAKSMYLNPSQLYNDFIVAYTRVSSAGQDIHKQVTYIKQYLKSINLSEDDIDWIKDNDISANKLSMEDRPGLEELRMKIKQRKVKKIIVYHRDRLARNFYEYVLLVKEFYKYDIEVIFLAINHPPFSKDLFTESLYGMLAQNNGQTIRNNNKDVMPQYPPSPWFGYIKEGKKSETKYILNTEISPKLSQFFIGASETQTAEGFFNLLVEFKPLFHNKRFDEILKYLSIPFYCGHMEREGTFKKLDHIEPLIDFETFQKIQRNLEKVRSQVTAAINVSLEHSSIAPVCTKCKTEMKFRAGKIGESGYYVCSNKHYQIKISVKELNSDIEEHFKEIMPRLDLKMLKIEISLILRERELHFNKKLKNLDRLILKTQEEISFLPPISYSKIKKKLEKVEQLKKDMEEVDYALTKVQDSLNELKHLSMIVKNYMISHIEQYQLYYLYHSFIKKIEIDKDKIIYYNPFSEFFKEANQN
ncbi:recombinase family protein [Bacillus sp. JJ1533]|uniref:recombinase family protein n=1 Tax=Bacillus sp. JJ1533 TaxID=3122959 RepID=UPI002FFE75BC